MQRARPEGSIDPDIVAAKLTHAAAHAIALRLAPARVVLLVADKNMDEPALKCVERAAAEEAAAMALVGISVAETFDYVSDGDPCKRRVAVPVDPDDPEKGTRETTVIDDGATVFKLGGLDVFVYGRITDNASSITRSEDDTKPIDFKTRLNASNIEAVRYGLKGWKHFTDQAGNDVPFGTVKRIEDGREYIVVSNACLKRLGLRLIGELGSRIREASEVSKAEQKNSVTA